MEQQEGHRRSIRIQGADYREAGTYFVTICAAEHREIFGSMEHGRVVLSKLGDIVQGCLLEVPLHFANAGIKEFVVMPNHVHAIIGLNVGARYIVPFDQRTSAPERFQKPVSGSIPTIIRTYKAAVSRQAKKELGRSGHEIWQRNYYERVIRNGKEFADASRYVMENPLHWEWDKENLRGKRQ
jgi:putative transposase